VNGCVGFELGCDRTTNANTLSRNDLPMRFSTRDCDRVEAVESRIQTKSLMFNGLEGCGWMSGTEFATTWSPRHEQKSS
jgi:hypothetical protein